MEPLHCPRSLLHFLVDFLGLTMYMLNFVVYLVNNRITSGKMQQPCNLIVSFTFFNLYAVVVIAIITFTNAVDSATCCDFCFKKPSVFQRNKECKKIAFYIYLHVYCFWFTPFWGSQFPSSIISLPLGELPLGFL